MKSSILRFTALALLGLAAARCTASNPSSASASVTAPKSGSPATNAAIKFADQPVTLTVQNAVATQSGTTYTFEVATDSAFNSKVQTKETSEGSNGSTSVVLGSLAGATDYYWHARATAGGTTGPFTATAKFTIGPAITLGTPTLLSPENNATTSPRPILRVGKVTRSGNAGALTYKFEISTSSAFTSIVENSTVPEGAATDVTFTPGNLPLNTTLFWRVTAIDAASGVTSPTSSVQSFKTRNFSQAETVATVELGQELWPGAVPPGDIGHATMGESGDFGVGWHRVQLHYGPGNVDFISPDMEMLRFFDLFDRGYHPDAAIAWMKSNGYPTEAVWYPTPEKAVLGLHFVYIASRGKVVSNSIWDIVLRLE